MKNINPFSLQRNKMKKSLVTISFAVITVFFLVTVLMNQGEKKESFVAEDPHVKEVGSSYDQTTNHFNKYPDMDKKVEGQPTIWRVNRWTAHR